MQALAAGANPDQDAYLRRYPELADALRGLFRTLDFVEATSRALRAEGLTGGQRLGDFRIVRELARGAWAWCTRRCRPRSIGASR